MALLPIKLKARNKGGAVTEVICDTVKDAQERFAELVKHGFEVAAEDTDGFDVDVSKLDA